MGFEFQLQTFYSLLKEKKYNFLYVSSNSQSPCLQLILGWRRFGLKVETFDVKKVGNLNVFFFVLF